MSSNAIGTVFRIVLIFLSLIAIWLIPLTIIYYLIALVLGIGFSFLSVIYLFLGIMIFRMFYPKNVFKT